MLAAEYQSPPIEWDADLTATVLLVSSSINAMEIICTHQDFLIAQNFSEKLLCCSKKLNAPNSLMN